MYQWILRRKGYKVSDTAYFLYVDALSRGRNGMLIDQDPHTAWMEFEAQIIPYEGDDSWVEGALFSAKELVQQEETVPHADDCDKARWLREASTAKKKY